ncbi:26S proteasome regulatory subunit RPN1, putative [Perkinsus marinus ATCC 50983]|uniref:26S proteasome regulatory subunit RPN1, putative n=1 Tax=Perkinsus marinus (strain ATCC 50983 / TXsc) TaxID=423536 RepID=C5L794_PERM5|nr:26S proteasome regulatory subunit RPN1, putative [Perkinsus marinus ATCC 50983]EER07356.1 26S proteasome regulatory subunit RPN1, putative [Perkinsus marinus ATCC 50983]|eukprot:XP_002775540.1 26S proteasome regulatory subunit RPN1, putative [Perkinsus marinus ATCC 50983]
MANGGGSSDNKKVLHAADEAERAAKERRRVMEEKRRKIAAEKELSEEDQQLKSLLEKQVETITSGPAGDIESAIQAIGQEMRSAASSMTSVPKPLKFLRAHFTALAAAYETMPDSGVRKELADVLAVLSTTIPLERSQEKQAKAGDDEGVTASVASSEEAPKEAESSAKGEQSSAIGHVKKGASLRYRLAGTNEDITKWGMEFMKTISGEIATEYQSRMTEGMDVTELIRLVDQIVPYNMSHSAETEAVDLLAETDGIDKLAKLVDSVTAPRVCQYLVGLAHFAANTEERRVLLNVTYQIFTQMKDLPSALIIAMRMNNFGRVRETMKAAIDVKEDRSIARQMCYIYARSSGRASGGALQAAEELGLDEDEDADLISILSNESLSTTYHNLAKDLDVVEAKAPEDVYKTHLEERGRNPATSVIDSAKQNLASTYVNALVNVGFGTDKLMTVEGSQWLYKNKDRGMLAAAASLGSIMLWDVDEGLAQIDKYQWSENINVKAGAMLGFGLASTGVTSDVDPAWALLAEQLDSNEPLVKMAAVMGLGFAYSGSRREDLAENLTPIVVDTEAGSLALSALASVSLALVFVGTGNTDIKDIIMATIQERQEVGLSLTAHFGGTLALGILYLQCGSVLPAEGGDKAMPDRSPVEDLLEEVEQSVKDEKLRKLCTVVVKSCGYAGSGDVLRVQELLHLLAETPDTNKQGGGDNADGQAVGTEDNSPDEVDDDVGGRPMDEVTMLRYGSDDAKAAAERAARYYQVAGVLGIGLIALGEEIGTEMTVRAMDNILQYCPPTIKRGVPLTLAMLFASNPKYTIIDTLSRLSHDADNEVAECAILSMGIVGAGTNNSRLAGLLRQLAAYYANSPNALYATRIAQGMLYCGKGLVSLSPLHSDRYLINPTSLASMLVVLFAGALNIDKTLFGSQYHFMLYYLVPCIYPRMVVTLLDKEDGSEPEPISVPVRVGQAVDTTGIAGKQAKAITGFQTHTTPVLLSCTDRAELATEEYIPVTKVIEGFVIIKKNKDFKAEELEAPRK